MANRCEHIGLSIGGHYHAASICKQTLTRQVRASDLTRKGSSVVPTTNNQ
jgi:hypothetical protein